MAEGEKTETELKVEKSIRRRINISTSVKGVKTWDCTVDAVGFPLEQVLWESDQLVAQLEKRYPIAP
jgi:hypothetical protein